MFCELAVGWTSGARPDLKIKEAWSQDAWRKPDRPSRTPLAPREFPRPQAAFGGKDAKLRKEVGLPTAWGLRMPSLAVWGPNFRTFPGPRVSARGAGLPLHTYWKRDRDPGSCVRWGSDLGASFLLLPPISINSLGGKGSEHRSLLGVLS